MRQFLTSDCVATVCFETINGLFGRILTELYPSELPSDICDEAGDGGSCFMMIPETGVVLYHPQLNSASHVKCTYFNFGTFLSSDRRNLGVAPSSQAQLLGILCPFVQIALDKYWELFPTENNEERMR